jgi:(p)ppGpp synthase/HD superfamily hydrolase
MTDFEFACAFAEKKHQGQLYGTQPYIEHLRATYNVACQFNLTDKVKTACWLHDTLEDTKTTYTELAEHFGTDVAEMVYCVTDELGRDRVEKKAKTYPKIRANADAILVKLCDRIANIEASIANNPKKLDKYVKENKGFIEQLYSDDCAESAIWQHYFSLIG